MVARYWQAATIDRMLLGLSPTIEHVHSAYAQLLLASAELLGPGVGSRGTFNEMVSFAGDTFGVPALLDAGREKLRLTADVVGSEQEARRGRRDLVLQFV